MTTADIRAIEPNRPTRRVQTGPPRLRLDKLVFFGFITLAFLGTEPFNEQVRVDLRGYKSSGSLFRQAYIVLTVGYLLATAKSSRFMQQPLTLCLNAVVLAWLILTVSWSLSPELATKRLITTLLTMLAIYLFWCSAGSRRLLLWLAVTLATLCSVSLVSGFFIPTAVHGTGSAMDVIGDWRGAFPHKNNAGFAAMIASLLAAYHYVTTRDRVWLLAFLSSFSFLILTNSKTSIGLAIATIIAFFTVNAISKSRLLGPAMVILPAYTLVGSILFVAVMWPEVSSFLQDPTTFTNRAYIWDLVLSVWSQAPFRGVGFGSLWEVNERNNAILGFLGGAQLMVVQGHNGYLDILATTGLIGLFLAIVIYAIVPISRAAKCVKFASDRTQPVFIICMISMMLSYNMMESFLLRNFHATWIVFLVVYFVAMDGLGKRNHPSFEAS